MWGEREQDGHSTRDRAPLLCTAAAVLAVACLLGSCSVFESGEEEFVPLPTRDPDRVAGQAAAERWIASYAGGLLVDEDAEMNLTEQEQTCVVTALAEDLEPAAVEAIAAAPSTDGLDPATLDDLVEIVEQCSDLEQYAYEFLVAEEYDAGTATCIAQAFAKVVTWVDLLALAPRAAAGEIDRERMLATYRPQLLDALAECGGGPGATLPF